MLLSTHLSCMQKIPGLRPGGDTGSQAIILLVLYQPKARINQIVDSGRALSIKACAKSNTCFGDPLQLKVSSP